MVDRFTDRIFPCVEFATGSPLCTATGATSATGAYNASKEGGGFGANARWYFANKHVVFGLHGFGGSGVGRYGAAQLSDLSINADGTLHLIKGYQGLTTLEYHGKKLDVYAYTGAEYAGRTYSFDPLANAGKGANVGYGAPTFKNYGCYIETAPTVNTGFTPGTLANCTGDTRAVIEGTTGFWYTFYNGPKGTVPVRHAVLLCDASDLVRRHRRSHRRHGHARSTLAGRAGRDGLHLVPLLLAVETEEVPRHD